MLAITFAIIDKVEVSLKKLTNLHNAQNEKIKLQLLLCNSTQRSSQETIFW
jgi:hypothetical protein